MIEKGLIDFTILLVDDRTENIILLQEVLAKENRLFLTATSGNEAFSWIGTAPFKL